MKALTTVLAFVFFISVLALQVPPHTWWGLSFLGVLAPILWFLNLLLLCYWLWKPSWWAALTVLALVAGLGIVDDTIAISAENEPDERCLQVLSYNVSHFGKPKGYNQVKDSSRLNNIQRTKEFVDWVVSNPAPIKCFQEFYTFPNNPLFNVDDKLRQEGWNGVFISADTLRVNKSRFGVAIYSKFPVLDQGLIYIGPNRFNRGIWADVDVNGKTLRVINVHFQSAQLQRVRQKSQGGLDAFKKMFWVYRASLEERNKQLQLVVEFIKKSPYPVLLCGDFNSTPYSHIYQLLDDELDNAFEEKGSGLGFTFNHPKLFFLRIDHQFASDDFSVCAFKTRQDIPYSAHFPLEGWYKFE